MRASTTTSLILTAALAAITGALPAINTNIIARAGGPAIVPIPSTCTVTNPLPTSEATSYEPGPSTGDIQLYSAYYPAFSSNKTLMAEQCLEQCYGYGTHVECKTAFWAQNIPTPAGYYGTPGGQLMTACLMFSRTLTGDDFVTAPAGQATDAFSGSIAC